MKFSVTIVTITLLGISSAANLDNAKFLKSFQTFNNAFFNQIVKSTSSNENIIYSPFSIQTGLAMTRMGADGQTAVEMDQTLGFTGQEPESVADNYFTMLAKYEESDILKTANKVYVMDNCELKDNYKELLSKKFFSSAVNINFGQQIEAARTINTWVETKTNDKIKNLISSDDLSSNTLMVLLNAIHFQGKWATAFDKNKTGETEFYTDETNSVKVEMMFRESECEIYETNELNATVLRLPYKDSDLSMLVILPFSRTGLPEVEEQLKDFQFESLGDAETKKRCVVRLPKFKTEFKIELKDTLTEMGMRLVFEMGADLSKMMKSRSGFCVSKVIHQAAIEVAEEGTEAAAATAVLVFWKSVRRLPYSFEANHPFVYAIVNGDNVPLFQGVFVQP